MAKEARVWKTYVRESDKSDKEMVDGRNSSLDVLLIPKNKFRTHATQAALFSAISTAFVIESLGDLKPDPAESSAQTLLVMSQMLAAIANNQPVASPSPDTLDPSPFSPSRTAVVVNMLWLLSLSLSVAVSLVAMLSKEWCFKFMSGRSGPPYEQARQRQRKWNGMERWKMKKALIYLSAMMHLALLLFALGLCLYLWDVNRRVALPVIVITGSATFVYTCATISPAVDRFCPYSTPAIEIIADAKTLLTTVFNGMSLAIAATKGRTHTLIEPIKSFWAMDPSLFGVGGLRVWGVMTHKLFTKPSGLLPSATKLPGPTWLWVILCFSFFLFFFGCWMIVLLPSLLLSALLSLFKWLLPWLLVPPRYAYDHVVKPAIPMIKGVSTAVKAIVDFGDKADGRYGDVIMDTVTSQMLAWLISNCEDSRSVDEALHAIAGAHRDLPHEPLVECQALNLVLARLDACNKQDRPPLAVKYCRTYAVLMSWSTFGVKEDQWRGDDATLIEGGVIYKHLTRYLDRTDLDQQAEHLPADSNLLASVVTTAMPMCHWGSGCTLNGTRLRKVLKIATSLMQQQLQRSVDQAPEPWLYALVDSTSHYLVALWPSEERSSSHDLLPILLVHTFLLYHETAPDVARSAAITLAATEFACRNYPLPTNYSSAVPEWLQTNIQKEQGGQPEVMKSRAREVLQYYKAHKPDEDIMVALFILGFFELLPHLDLDDPETRRAAAASYLPELMQQVPQFDFWRSPGIHTLGYLPEDLVYHRSISNLTIIAKGTHLDELQVMYACLPLLCFPLGEYDFPRLYILALMALCRAKSSRLRDLCINIIDKQPVPLDLRSQLDSADNKTLLEGLCRTLIDANTPVLPIAVLHFEILIASVATGLSEPIPPQHGLRSLLAFCDRFPELKTSSPLSTTDVSHSMEGFSEDFRRNSMLHAMQCVVNLCEAGSCTDDDYTPWGDVLRKLKDSYKPGTRMVQRLGRVEPGTSSDPIRAEASSSEDGVPSGSGHLADDSDAIQVTGG
ncbi:hypothetical protein FRC06_011417 [Ceratobasidium sp. 370]|nr:hypothetical protein FRC06_011417 [Ceratobasidium sp. 370]